MADGSVTVTGLKELENGIRVLPESVTKALRQVAMITATRVMERAKPRTPYDPQHRDVKRPHLRDTYKIVPDDANKQFKVEVGGTVLPMLPVWLEFGTAHMTARPFLRPAADAEEQQYKQAMINAAEAIVTKVLDK